EGSLADRARNLVFRIRPLLPMKDSDTTTLVEAAVAGERVKLKWTVSEPMKEGSPEETEFREDMMAQICNGANPINAFTAAGGSIDATFQFVNRALSLTLGPDNCKPQAQSALTRK